MFKSFTLCAGLAAALLSSSAVLAGGHGGVLPAPQALPTEQGIAPSAQSVPVAAPATAVCEPGHGLLNGLQSCLSDKLCSLGKALKPKPKCYTYTWVLKKKKVHGGLFGGHKSSCGGCDSCDSGYAAPVTETIYPTGQSLGTPQTYGSGQAYGSGQVYGTGQVGAIAPVMEPAPGIIPAAGDEAPPAPATPTAFLGR